MSRFTNPVPQFWLDNGEAASAGRMHFFENKNYSVRKNTFSQPDNTIPNTNPIILDGQGRLPACFGEGLYSVRLHAANPANPAIDGALQWSRDDVSLSDIGGQFELWSPAETYKKDEFARDPSDGAYYRLFGATTSAGEQPSANPTKWEKQESLFAYNASRSYITGANVISNGYLYRANTNVSGVAPPSAQWDNLSFNNSITGDFAVSGATTVGGLLKNTLGKIQIGADAGTKAFIRNDSKISTDNTNYFDIANRRSVRVALAGGFNASQFVVIEKIGRTVTITSSGDLTHPAASAPLSGVVIPAEYRIGGNYSAGQSISYGFISNAGYLASIDINFDGTIRISYFDYAGAVVSRTSVGKGFSVSYAITSETP